MKAQFRLDANGSFFVNDDELQVPFDLELIRRYEKYATAFGGHPNIQLPNGDRLAIGIILDEVLDVVLFMQYDRFDEMPHVFVDVTRCIGRGVRRRLAARTTDERVKIVESAVLWLRERLVCCTTVAAEKTDLTSRITLRPRVTQDKYGKYTDIGVFADAEEIDWWDPEERSVRDYNQLSLLRPTPAAVFLPQDILAAEIKAHPRMVSDSIARGIAHLVLKDQKAMWEAAA